MVQLALERGQARTMILILKGLYSMWLRPALVHNTTLFAQSFCRLMQVISKAPARIYNYSEHYTHNSQSTYCYTLDGQPRIYQEIFMIPPCGISNHLTYIPVYTGYPVYNLHVQLHRVAYKDNEDSKTVIVIMARKRTR